MCEVFNARIIDARDKPIITCLEFIREYLMKRIITVERKINKSEGHLTPTATKLLEEIRKEAEAYKSTFCGNGKYQVLGPWMDQCVVNLNERTCSCGKWQVSGIPCKHSVNAMWDTNQNPEALVHDCYRLSTWRAMYDFKIDPINGRNMWAKSDCPITLTPPKHHKQVGRPKKKRQRAEDEVSSQATKLSRKFLTVTCSKCHNKGHNSRSCKGQGGPSDVGKGKQKV